MKAEPATPGRWSLWRLWPGTLGSQLILVTALAVLLSNVMVVAWFTLGNERNEEDAMSVRLIDRAASTARLISRIPGDMRGQAVRAFTSNVWGVYDLHHGTLKYVSMSADERKLAARLKNFLPTDLLRYPASVHYYATVHLEPPPDDEHGADPPGQDAHFNMPPRRPRVGEGRLRHHSSGEPPPGRILEVIIPLSADTQLVATFFRPPVLTWPAQIILLAAAVTIIFASLAAAFIAQQVSRPLSKLAQAAQSAAHGDVPPHVPEDGPDDVRNAARAFNAMNDQVQRTLESQRHLLSAVGHDLRTPITAMRINIEFVQDEELAARLEKNLDELQSLTEAVLSAARGVSGEKMRQVDMSALTESVVADLIDMDVPVSWGGGVSAPFPCRPNEIRRAVRNLIENAVAYGKQAEVAVVSSASAYEIVVDDRGPGIPEKDRERVFEPFVRLESSRNLATGGVGLGLTLVRSIVEAHGGHIILGDREGGGLRVRVVLPHLA